MTCSALCGISKHAGTRGTAEAPGARSLGSASSDHTGWHMEQEGWGGELLVREHCAVFWGERGGVLELVGGARPIGLLCSGT